MFGEGGFIEGGESDPGLLDENAPSDAASRTVLRELTEEEKSRSFAISTMRGSQSSWLARFSIYFLPVDLHRTCMIVSQRYD